MPSFETEELEIYPDDFLSACSSKEKEELVQGLIEDGYITPKDVDNLKMAKSNHNDEKFWESLNHLKRFRHLLSLEEENFINNLAEKFKHL